jgi:hypothetical protein
VIQRTCCCVLALSLYCSAVDKEEARYVGGTLDNSKIGAIGHLTLSSPDSMTYESGTMRVRIPYADIVSYQYREEVTHHLGVLPAIAVGMLKHRQHKHLFTVDYLDDQNTKQIAVFEVSKQAAVSVRAVLDAKGAHTCIQYQPCIPKPSASVAIR